MFKQPTNLLNGCLWHRVNEKSQVTMPLNENDGKTTAFMRYIAIESAPGLIKKPLIKSDTLVIKSLKLLILPRLSCQDTLTLA